jgi:hypothetical protein
VSETEQAIKGIDHLIVRVDNLDRSNSLWTMLGFLTTPRGFHDSGGTANHLIMLDRTYIELLGIVDPKAPATMAEETPGLKGIALKGLAQSAFRLWNTLGFDVAAPASLSRGVDVAGRRELARFQLTVLARSRELPFMIFCCEHLTPQFVWQPQVPHHANGAHRLREVVLIVADDHTRQQFERITGRPASVDSAGSHTIQLEECRMTFLTEANFARRFGADAALWTRARPMIAAIVIASTDIKSAQAQAQNSGVPIRPTSTGGFFTTLADEGLVVEWEPAPT